MLKIRISKYIQSEQFCGKTELFCTFCSTWQVKTAHCNGMPEYLITKVGIVVFDLYHYNAAFQNFSGRSSGVTFGQRQRRNEIVLLAAASVVVLAVAALAGIVPLTEQARTGHRAKPRVVPAGGRHLGSRPRGFGGGRPGCCSRRGRSLTCRRAAQTMPCLPKPAGRMAGHALPKTTPILRINCHHSCRCTPTALVASASVSILRKP